MAVQNAPAQTAPAQNAPGQTAPARNAAAQSVPAETAPAPEEKPGIVPLESGGLTARMLRSLDHWMDNFAAQMREAALAAKEIPALLAHSRAVTTEAGQRLLALLALSLVAAFAAGLALEWGLHRALRRPRRALEEHANRQTMRQIVRHEVAHASTEKSPAPITTPTTSTTPTTATTPEPPAAACPAPLNDTAQAGLAPPSEGVAVIRDAA